MLNAALGEGFTATWHGSDSEGGGLESPFVTPSPMRVASHIGE